MGAMVLVQPIVEMEYLLMSLRNVMMVISKTKTDVVLAAPYNMDSHVRTLLTKQYLIAATPYHLISDSFKSLKMRTVTVST